MLKKFYTYNFGSHINYVDHNNRYAGMHDNAYCCEDVGHRIYDKDGEEVYPTRTERDAAGNSVDVYENLEFANEPPTETQDREYAEDGGEVRFKLINPTNGAEYTLEFHNYHNGYYAHTVEYGTIEHDKREIDL